MRAMAAALKEEFDRCGYVRIDGAVDARLAAGLRDRMAEASRGRQAGPTVKLGDDAAGAPLIMSPPLRAAFDALLGSGRWVKPDVLEDLRVKFPGPPRPGWWHIDVFERGPLTVDEDLFSWRASPGCGGVGLLVLLLLSDVGPADCATALRAGSHRAVARRLKAAGAAGLSLGELLALGIDAGTADAPVSLTTGPAGTAFLCHPMLVHAAMPHTGDAPSYWALPVIRLAPSEP
jgi:hypothetical protein